MPLSIPRIAGKQLLKKRMISATNQVSRNFPGAVTLRKPINFGEAMPKSEVRG